MTDTLMKSPASVALKKPRLGFLGVGWIGRHRMEAMLATGRVEAAAVVDPSDQNAEDALALDPTAERVGSFEEMLSLGLDGVVIATPSALHAEQSIQALEAGLAVFCQKPLGRSEAEVRAVVDCAREADRLLAVDLSYRFTEGMRRIRDLTAGGSLGQIFGVDLTFHNAYGPDKPWFYDPRLSGGGCVMDLGVHMVDLALWALDWPEVVDVQARLFAKGRPLEDQEACEDYAVATLTLASGAAVRVACSWGLAAGKDAEIGAAFYGSEGGAVLRNVDGSFYDFTAERTSGQRSERLCSPPDAWGGRAAADWARRLADGQGHDPDTDRLVEVARVLDRIYGRRP